MADHRLVPGFGGLARLVSGGSSGLGDWVGGHGGLLFGSGHGAGMDPAESSGGAAGGPRFGLRAAAPFALRRPGVGRLGEVVIGLGPGPGTQTSFPRLYGRVC